MDLAMGIGEKWTGLLCFITDRDDQIHWMLRSKLFNALCTMPSLFADVNIQFGHHPHHQRMHRARMRSCTKNLKG